MTPCPTSFLAPTSFLPGHSHLKGRYRDGKDNLHDLRRHHNLVMGLNVRYSQDMNWSLIRAKHLAGSLVYSRHRNRHCARLAESSLETARKPGLCLVIRPPGSELAEGRPGVSFPAAWTPGDTTTSSPLVISIYY
jgi:hypothetical protein